MSGWPESLKPIGKFMARAREIESIQPVVAYHCNYYSLKKAIELRDPSDPAAMRFVTGLLEKCETAKATLPPDEDGAHRALVVEFALSVFDRADSEDRAERATKDTALTFYAAMCFLEVCSVFGPLGDELEERLRYAKWKAADITKALKEGRKPIPGAPGEAEARDAELKRAAAEQGLHGGDHATSASAENGVPPAPPVSEYDAPAQPLYPQFSSKSEFPPAAPKYPSSDAPSPLSGTREAAPPQAPSLDIGAPPAPALDIGGAPQVPSMALPENQQPAASAFSSPSFYESMKAVESSIPPSQLQKQAPAPVVPIEPAEISPPPAAAPAPAPAPAPVAAPVPVAAPAPAPMAVARSLTIDPNYRPSVKQTQEAQRLAKYAASALDFQDVKTAVDNMERALGLLRGPIQ